MKNAVVVGLSFLPQLKIKFGGLNLLPYICFMKHKLTEEEFNNLVTSYLATAEFVAFDSSDGCKGVSDQAREVAQNDCGKFTDKVYERYGEEIAHNILTYQGKDLPSLAGHDFYLTQNHHGAGFWDGDIYDTLAPNGMKVLTELSQQISESNPILGGEDKLLYLE